MSTSNNNFKNILNILHEIDCFYKNTINLLEQSVDKELFPKENTDMNRNFSIDTEEHLCSKENASTIDNLIADIVNILISIYWDTYPCYDETYEVQISSIFTFLKENPRVLSYMNMFKNNLSNTLGDDTLEYFDDFQKNNQTYLDLVFSWDFHNVHIDTCRKDVILSEFLRLGKKCQILYNDHKYKSYIFNVKIDFVCHFYAINSIFFVMSLLSK